MKYETKFYLFIGLFIICGFGTFFSYFINNIKLGGIFTLLGMIFVIIGLFYNKTEANPKMSKATIGSIIIILCIVLFGLWMFIFRNYT